LLKARSQSAAIWSFNGSRFPKPGIGQQKGESERSLLSHSLLSQLSAPTMSVPRWRHASTQVAVTWEVRELLLEPLIAS
jgi:hypothetical protein